MISREMSKLKKWHIFSAFLLLGVLVFLLKVYSSYTYSAGRYSVGENDIVGYWIQTDESLRAVIDDAPFSDKGYMGGISPDFFKGKRPFIFLDIDGNYYQNFDYPGKSNDRKKTGSWYFKSTKTLTGHYKNWLKLDIPKPDAPEYWLSPDFFFLKKEGELFLYKNTVPEDVSKYKFRKLGEGEIEEFKRRNN